MCDCPGELRHMTLNTGTTVSQFLFVAILTAMSIHVPPVTQDDSGQEQEAEEGTEQYPSYDSHQQTYNKPIM